MNNKTDLLWTGGWDSTFRLLQLLFIEKKVIKPHYVVMSQECTGKEIDTIHKIRRKISREYPEKRGLMLPMAYTSIGEIKKNEVIATEYKEITKLKKLNIQYEILARYCDQIGVTSMELCVLDHEAFNDFRSNFIIFKYFKFPILGFTKPEMAKIVEKEGWNELMEMTWFCRRPKNGRPCGLCGPCTDVAMAGMGWRLPLRVRIIANLQLPLRRWWRDNYKKQDKGILKYVPMLLKNKF